MRRSTPWFAVLLLGLVWLPAACNSTYGSRQLRQGHLAYNQAVKGSVDEELLLNIVRLRYLDTVEFMTTSSISSQSEINVGLGGSVGELGPEEFSGATGNIGWATRPTFTFTPQRGGEFAQRLLGPIDLDRITYLASSNWPIEKLMRLFVADMGGLANQPRPGEATQFARLTELLKQLQLRGDVAAGFVEAPKAISQPIATDRVTPADYVQAAEAGYRYEAAGDGRTLTLQKPGKRTAVLIRPGAPEAAEIRALLNLADQERPYFTIDVGAQVVRDAAKGDRILVRTRSLLMAMSHLARGVHVPDSHIEQGLTTYKWPTRASGPEDYAGFFQVHVSCSCPRGQLAVPYRGHYFWIADNDRESKLTFLMLATLYRLKLSGATPENTPVLTLPVGR